MLVVHHRFWSQADLQPRSVSVAELAVRCWNNVWSWRLALGAEASARCTWLAPARLQTLQT